MPRHALRNLPYMRKIRLMSIALCLASSLALIGCEQSQSTTDLGPQLDADGGRRSLAMDTSLLQHLKNRQASPEGLAWYDGRNDRSLTVNSGYDLASVQTSSTLTRDRQYSSNGRVRDNFSSTTYRTEYRQNVR